MRLLELRATNFKTIQETLTVPLAKRGLVVLVGENGAGKTTFLDAIVWCLYGLTLRGIGGDDVVSEHVGKNTHVSLTLEDSRGVVWTVDRYRKHKKFKNQLHLKTGDIDKTQHKVEDTEAEIMRLTGLTYEAFMTVSIIGEGVLKPFSTITPPEQGKVIDRITGSDVLQPALKAVRTRKQAVVSELSDYDAQRNQTESRIQELREDLQDLEREARHAKDRRKAQIKEARQTLDEAKTALEKAQVPKSKKTVELLDTARTEYKQHDDKAMRLKGQLGSLSGTLDMFAKKLHHYEQKKAGAICNECGVEVTEEGLRKLRREMASKFESVKLEYESLERIYTKVVALKREANARVEKYHAVVSAAPDLNALEKHHRRALAAYKAAKETKAESNAVERTQTKIAEKTEALEVLAVDHKKAKRRLRYLEWCESEFGTQLRLDIQNAVLPYLNNQAQRYSDIITNGTTRVEFAPERTTKKGESREGITVVAENNEGSKHYKLQSTGERQKVDIIVASALQALSTEMSHASVNIAVYDEVYDHLDSKSIVNVTRFLQDELKHRESVFVVTHNEQIQAEFPNVIFVSKTSKGTQFSS